MKKATEFSRQQIKKIAESYAHTDSKYSADYFSREYRISTNTFYTLLDKAVVESIVDLSVVNLMKNKACKNAKLHAGDAAYVRSARHYDHLIMKREIFIPSTNKCIQISTEFVKSNLSFETYSKKNCMPKDFLVKIFHTALDSNRLSKKNARIIEETLALVEN